MTVINEGCQTLDDIHLTDMTVSDSMVQTQMDRDPFRNISNLDLVEPNRIRNLIYACIRLLFANFLTLKMLHTCIYRSTTQDFHPTLAVTSIIFLFVADVKCGLYEINKNSRANVAHGPSLVQKMFQDRTEVTLDCRGPGPEH